MMKSIMTSSHQELPIGIFDSGMGGLTVLRELKNLLPNESFLYLGDTARLPYGTKSQSIVIHYALRMTELLVKRGIKLLVVACGTATSAALPHLQAHFPHLPIIGVIEPGALSAVGVTRNQHIALLATETTIRSNVYQKTLHALDPCIKISTQSCGLFVALAEEGCIDDDIAHAAVRKYLTPLIKSVQPCDTVILGCTHFPVLIKPIQSFLGADIAIVNPAFETAKATLNKLSQLQLNNDSNKSQHIHYLVTDLPERFCRLGELFLGLPISADDVFLVDSHGEPEDDSDNVIELGGKG